MIRQQILLFLLPFFFIGNLSAQRDVVSADSSVKRLQVYESFDLPSNFKGEYRRMLRRVRRVYPLALHAAYVLDSLEREVDAASRDRKKRKIAKQTHKDLKSDFKFLLKELYVSEGVVLTKLIYRETGKTAREIIADYKGETQAGVYATMASMFDQDLESTYDPNGEDFVIECVIQDIESGKVAFDSTFVTVDRAHYRKDKKAYKERVKRNKKELKKQKRETRKKERKARKKKKSER